MVTTVDYLVSYYSSVSQKYKIFSITKHRSIYAYLCTGIGFDLFCPLCVCHQLMDHAVRMAGTSVQHKLHLHNLYCCDCIEAKENERK